MSATGEAHGKIILCGEHAVVHGRPAIAVPVSQVSARVTIERAGHELVIDARDLNQTYRYSDLDPNHPLGAIIRLVLYELGEAAPPQATLTISSTIPIASGLGSGAAVSTAIVRALARFYGHTISTKRVSSLVYRVERIHHGTPSGIDNTVIAFGRPVYFVRPSPPSVPEGIAGREDPQPIIKPFTVAAPFRIAIADTGIASPTRIAVDDVRKGWEAERAKYEALFDRCAEIANAAFDLIQSGRPDELGPLLTDNHRLLREMTVSSPGLDLLVEAALRAGALGAKLSGGGRGGNMIALVTGETAGSVEEVLLAAGAKRVIMTEIG